MKSMGMGKELRKRILAEKHHQVRKTKTAMFWGRETFEARYLFLKDVDNDLLGRGQRFNQKVRLSERLQNKTEASRKGKESDLEAHEDQSSRPEVLYMAANKSVAPDEKHLFKGGLHERFKATFQQPRTPTGPAYTIQEVRSTLPTDFSQESEHTC